MAKYQTSFTGDFQQVLDMLHRGIMRASRTASYEDGSDFDLGPVRVATRVYERYSLVGGNRASLAVTLVGQGDVLGLSMIASGGSQAIVMKVQAISEYNFLDTAVKVVRTFLEQTGQMDADAEVAPGA